MGGGGQGGWVRGGGVGSGGGGLGVKVDVNEELKFWLNFTKKILGGSVAEGVRWGDRAGVGGGQGGCERNIGGRGDVGYTKVLYNIKKMKNVGGGGNI